MTNNLIFNVFSKISNYNNKCNYANDRVECVLFINKVFILIFLIQLVQYIYFLIESKSLVDLFVIYNNQKMKYL